MISEFLPALKLFFTLTLLTGVAYPLLVTGVAQTLFKPQANGSVVSYQGKQIGSSLIAQEFKEKKFFHARPSAVAYNPLPSGGSNAAPTSADWVKAVQERKAAGEADDLLFASASGLDPEISPSAALSQIIRISGETGLASEKLEKLVENRIQPKTFGFLGEPRVNVLMLNLDLLEATPGKR